MIIKRLVLEPHRERPEPHLALDVLSVDTGNSGQEDLLKTIPQPTWPFKEIFRINISFHLFAHWEIFHKTRYSVP